MFVYFPIAESSFNLFLILGLGGSVGILSGLFGVGGGFLMTPLLVVIGIPPAIASSTGANQIIASSVSGLMGHWRNGNVDFRMGSVLIAGGAAGALVGIQIFDLLLHVGEIGLVVSILYVVMLSSLGALMLAESLRALIRRRKGPDPRRGRLHRHTFVHGFPMKMRFPKSQLYISALLPLGLGFLVGIMTAIMGVGGGFIMVPAMIYLIGMRTTVAIGTSLLQITVVSAVVTLLHAITTHTVDALLALILAIGGAIGAQIGVRLSSKLRGEELRFLLAVVVLSVGIEIGLTLVNTPLDPFSLWRAIE
jgi:uncharacterized membrane protein YfcA